MTPLDPIKPVRRQFLQSAVAGGAAIALGASGETPGDEPIFRFVQWNDTHADATEPPAYALANEKVKHLVESLAAGNAPAADFVILCGDMIHGEGLPALGPDLDLFRELIAPLKCPVYPVVGNHEVVQQEGNPQFLAAYRRVFGDGRTNYTFRHRGLQFVVLDNSGAPASNGTDVGQRRNGWLRDVLAESKGVPTILCCHVPLVPVRDEKVLRKSFGFGSYTAHDRELVDLVDAHADSIVAVLSGHLHLTGVVQRNGVYHVSIAGTASYPCDVASFEVYPDRIRMQVLGLPASLVTPETNIHGTRRHGIDYTDTSHPTPEAYVMGNADERTVDMPLRSRL